MKIRPVILCGGAGTRLWPNSKNHQAKQFIDFGNWTFIRKELLIELKLQLLMRRL